MSRLEEITLLLDSIGDEVNLLHQARLKNQVRKAFKEQAERVEELERKVHYYEVVTDGLHERSEMHRKYKKRYKQALETIAQETGTPYADIAIKALAGDNS